MLVITHYQRLLDYIRPDRVHVLAGGRIVASGGPELAHELEREGYDKYASGRRMSLARAIETGDLAELPSRRDEDWRWTDLRGLIRALPPASPRRRRRAARPGRSTRSPATRDVDRQRPAAAGAIAVGRRARVAAPCASSRARRRRPRGAATPIEVADGATLVLLESYEGEAPATSPTSTSTIAVGEGARAGADRAGRRGRRRRRRSSAPRSSSGAGAQFAQTVLTSRRASASGSRPACSHPGGGAAARLDGVYLLADQRHADLTTVVTHDGMRRRPPTS